MGIGDRDYMRSDDPVGVSFNKRKSHFPLFPSNPVKAICTICIITFVIQYLFGIGWVKDSNIYPGEYPVGATGKSLLFSEWQLWTLITYIFVHGDIFHIAFNLIFIASLGKIVLGLIGVRKFLALFLLSGIFGALIHVLVASRDLPLVGASASAFGLLAAVGILIPNQVFHVLLFMIIPIRCRPKHLAMGIIIVEIVFIIIDKLAINQQIPFVSGIAHGAHLGGALVGWLFIKSLRLNSNFPNSRSSRIMRWRKDNKILKRNFKNRGKVVSATVVTNSNTDNDNLMDIDPLLDKISENGFGSLTEEEKEILQRYSKEIGKNSNE